MALLDAVFADSKQGMTPEQVERRRAIAKQLSAQAQPRNITHPMQGVAQMVAAAMSGLNESAARRGEEAGSQRRADALKGLIGGGGAPAPAAQADTMSFAGNNAPAGAGDLRSGIASTAQALGVNPVDLATAISYETAGTFDPAKKGPTTQWGQHKGLIQFGEPQAKQYGVDWSDPVGSQLGPDGAVAKYLRDTGVQPGMGLLDIYSAINAGGVGKYGASDANNGGAPGTVRDKVQNQMAGHRAKAMAMFPEPQPTQAEQVVTSFGGNNPPPQGQPMNAPPQTAQPMPQQVASALGGMPLPQGVAMPGAGATAGEFARYNAEQMRQNGGGLQAMLAQALGGGGQRPPQQIPQQQGGGMPQAPMQQRPGQPMPITPQGGGAPQGPQGGLPQQIAAMLNDPYTRDLGEKLAMDYYKQQNAGPAELPASVQEFKFGQDNPEFVDYQKEKAQWSQRDQQRERRITDMTGRGIPMERAQDIADGVEKLVTDPVTGNTDIVNVITGNARRVNYDDPADKAIVDNDTEEARGRLIEAGGQENAPTLWNSLEGVPGATGAATEWYGRVAGQIPGTDLGSEVNDVTSNRQLFRLAQGDLIRSLSINPRFPVAEMERLREETDVGPSIWDSPESLRQRMITVNTYLKQRMQTQLDASRDRTLPPQTRQDAAANAQAIQSFVNIMGVPEGATASGSGRSGGMDFSNMSMDQLEAIDPSGLSVEDLDAMIDRVKRLGAQ